MTDDDMPSAPLTRDAAWNALADLIDRVPDIDLRAELYSAVTDYGHAAATQVLNRMFPSART